MKFISQYILLGIVIIQQVRSEKHVFTSSLLACMENSQLSSTLFNVTYFPDTRSLYYDIDISTQLSGEIIAELEVFAYGHKVASKQISLCNFKLKQFCPIYPGNIRISSVQELPEEYTEEIPSIAFEVPDIDAYLIAKFYRNDTDFNNGSKQELACIQAFFSNGITVSHVAVQWCSAIFCGLGIMISMVFVAYSKLIFFERISNVALYLLLYFQSVVVISMTHVHRVPPIVQAWVKNFTWSVGLINVNFLQDIFRWYVESTGGNPPLHISSTTTSILTQKRLLKEPDLIKRSANTLYGNTNTLIVKGIERVAYNVGIENTSIVCTVFTNILIFGVFIVIISAVVLIVCYTINKRSKPTNRDISFKYCKQILKEVISKYFMLCFQQLMIFGFWEWTKQDSPAVVLLSVIFVLSSLAIIASLSIRIILASIKSKQKYSNAKVLMYGDEDIFNRYGYFYTMFKFETFWWSYIIILQTLLKAIFIGFLQVSGKAESISIFMIDAIYVILLLIYKPYLDAFTNVLTIVVSVVVLLNSFMFVLFSDLFGQSYSVSAVLGVLFFIVNGLFSIVLFIATIVYIILCLLGERYQRKRKHLESLDVVEDKNKKRIDNEVIVQTNEYTRSTSDDFEEPPHIANQPNANCSSISINGLDSDNWVESLVSLQFGNRENLSVDVPDVSLYGNDDNFNLNNEISSHYI
ncbi:hypothetical protein TPHA_0J02560 [Tetrapisispora phaffii CBS 4417]|uniref:ML-like domain-containing protein n=1 Tax=Tetrapisispora phaffii (strain ATCC 24235 / CBS 4417 / NBRC 1672 / NRRL Y-8282 / UCD 70-5) TaxID=1071381 RepID=G8BYY4_TETPH|nr:hypothetical protein TPHA_0J02560 [Tetrapisispora phaffii CBS 4417]CCE65076.1 hypothetical protein TPHA_0J02560 [Tetrapisispora phaffii CBS 4417]